MDNQQVTDFELGWLIGILEGEGSFTLSKQSDVKITPGIKLVNTNFDIIEEVCRILKALGVGHFVYNSWRSGNQKPAKRVEINGLLRIKKFLDIGFDRIPCRVAQAKVLKDFVELRLSKDQKEPYSDDEHSMYHLLRSLNK